ncbi:TspO/MBR family protein [Arthrobacter sp. zg-Y820]|uniref:TspO/MBR family protein n=1 Tax=unclassified Arthrobacter TaxID=235627 RepID=UPI001E51842E|nr:MULTISPECIES: TspO/MBR family protein [unclassified Arthrobacter]MCC9197945.1 tryptophan-rich sensory protein [Arthrobacter sp. zg-Y820]MDK1280812.1 TspO/MBR family protein [Arthrobacter sp. zg.Y820]WIB10296.1 TspO/MBR family protein [Arthrobacter sp. zg-Y820]
MTTSSPGTRPAVPGARGSDLPRQLTVTVCFIVCLVGSMIGVGVFGGTPIAQAAGGALNADATYLAPASGAFSIWSVIYTGLGAYTLWQWLPSERTSERQRSLGWLVAASLLLNAGWILSVQAGWVGFSVLVIVALLAVLAVCFARYSRTPARNWIEAVVVDGTLGLYLGWVSVATCANIAAALSDAGWNGFGLAPEVWSITVLAVVAALGVALAAYGRGRLAPAAALAWGLSWIAVSRLNGELPSSGTAFAAVAAAVVVALAAVVYRFIGRNRIPAAATARR